MKAIKKNLIRFCAVLLCFCAILSFLPFSASAETELPSFDSARAVILYSPIADKIIASKNPDKIIYPSATAKITSGLLLCEIFSERLTETVTLSSDMLKASSGRKFGLSVGMKLTLEDLMKIALCGSFNDAYTALAVIAEGSTDAFVDKMNARVAELGAFSTSFSNVCGLDGDGMQTTARDVMKISVAALKNELFMRLSSTYSYTVNAGGTKTVENRNELHNFYGDHYNPSALGLCAGTTDLGGNCLVTKGEFNGEEYLCIVMGAEENTEYPLVSSMLAFAEEHYNVITLKEKGEVVGTLPVTLSDASSEVSLVLSEDIKILVSSDAPVDNDYSFDLILTKDSAAAPIEGGSHVGYMTAQCDGELLASVSVVTASTVQNNPFLSLLDSMKAFVTGRVFISFAIFAVVAVIVFFIGVAVFIELGRKKRRRNYRVTRFR